MLKENLQVSIHSRKQTKCKIQRLPDSLIDIAKVTPTLHVNTTKLLTENWYNNRKQRIKENEHVMMTAAKAIRNQK